MLKLVQRSELNSLFGLGLAASFGYFAGLGVLFLHLLGLLLRGFALVDLRRFFCGRRCHRGSQDSAKKQCAEKSLHGSIIPQLLAYCAANRR
jgi:hypothetical protein